MLKYLTKSTNLNDNKDCDYDKASFIEFNVFQALWYLLSTINSIFKETEAYVGQGYSWLVGKPGFELSLTTKPTDFLSQSSSTTQKCWHWWLATASVLVS